MKKSLNLGFKVLCGVKSCKVVKMGCDIVGKSF